MSCLRLLQSAVAIAMSVVLFAGIDLNADKDHSTLDGQKSLANKGERLLHILTYGAANLNSTAQIDWRSLKPNLSAAS